MDVPYICNNGRAGRGGWASPFLLVGAPAVNSGVQLGWVHSLCGVAGASRSCSAFSAAWKLTAVRWPRAAGCAQRGLFHFGLHVGHGHALPCVNNPYRLNPRLVGSGRYWTVRAKAPEDPGRDRSPGIPRVGGTNSLRRSGSRLGCRVLPQRHRRVVLPPEPLRRLQDPAARVWDWFPMAQGETEALGGLEHLPQAGLRRRDG